MQTHIEQSCIVFFHKFDTGYMFRPFRQDTHEKRKYFFKKALAFFVNIWYHIGALVEGAI